MIYLDYAATSWPKPPAVSEAMAAVLADPGARSWEADRAAVAASLGIADPEHLLITPGCTAALATVIPDLPWNDGDRVLISGMEHHALVRPVLRCPAEVVVAPRAADGPVDLGFVEDALRDGVRLVAISMIASTTGEVLPYREVLAMAREHGAWTLLDAAQAAGWHPIDLGELAPDILVFAGHKGPHGPKGVGGLYIAPGLALTTPAATCSGEACALRPGYCDAGSVNEAALAGLAEGWAWVAGREAPAVDPLREGLARIPGVRVVAHGPRAVAVAVDGWAATSVGAALAERGVKVSAGLQCAPLAHQSLGTDPDGVIRFSVGPCTSPEDLVRAPAALADLRD